MLLTNEYSDYLLAQTMRINTQSLKSHGIQLGLNPGPFNLKPNMLPPELRCFGGSHIFLKGLVFQSAR